MKRKFMNSKEVKVFLSALVSQYGAVPELFRSSAFASGRDKIYLVNKSINQVDLEQLNINSIGLYIAEFKNGQVRLPIEGAQLIGPVAEKNVCEISKSQVRDWLKGSDLKIEGDYEGFVIVKHKGDFLGSGKFRNGTIFNYVPKIRRVLDLHQ